MVQVIVDRVLQEEVLTAIGARMNSRASSVPVCRVSLREGGGVLALELLYSAKSDTGLKRLHNEDRFGRPSVGLDVRL